MSDQHRTPTTATRPSFLQQRGGDLVRNVSVLALVYLAYATVRSVTADEVSTAMGNAADLMHFQNVIGLPSELGFQRSLLDRTMLLRGANIYYIGVHFPVTVLFLGWVWLRHRYRFDRVRNALVGATAAGLAVHVMFPLAPPRMLSGFVDTAAVLGPNPYDMKVSAAANQIAAMPSLHVGWALLVAVGVISILNTKWSLVALVHPVITAGVVVVTANHYWTDAIVGGAIVVAAWMFFRGADRAKYHAPELRLLAARPGSRPGRDLAVTPVRRTFGAPAEPAYRTVPARDPVGPRGRLPAR